MSVQAISNSQLPSLSIVNKAKIVKAVVFVLALILIWVYRSPVQETLSFVSDREGLIAYLGDYGKLGSVLLFVILFLQVILAAIPGHAFMVAGGYLYGFLAGFALIHTATVIASQFAYWLAKKFGRPIVEKLAPSHVLETWTARAEHQGVTFFIFSFILPVFPSDVMNFVAGLSGLSARKFLAANFIGRLPGSLLFAFIGSHGFQITPALLVVAVVFTLVVFTLWRKFAPDSSQ